MGEAGRGRRERSGWGACARAALHVVGNLPAGMLVLAVTHHPGDSVADVIYAQLPC